MPRCSMGDNHYPQMREVQKGSSCSFPNTSVESKCCSCFRLGASINRIWNKSELKNLQIFEKSVFWSLLLLNVLDPFS